MMVLPYPLNAADGGVQRSTLQMGEYFSRIGWEVAYVSLSSEGHAAPSGVTLFSPVSDLLSETDARIHSFLRHAVQCFRPEVIFNQIGLPRQPACSLSRLRSEGFDFKVIACFRNSPAFYRQNAENDGFLSRRFGGLGTLIPGSALIDRLVTKIHQKKTSRLFRLALQRCDQLMLLAPSYIDDLEWYLPALDRSKIVVVPNAYVLPGEIDWTIKENHLLYVGRLAQVQKNVMVLPELWKKLEDAEPFWEFHIVGYGPDTQRLKDRFKELDCKRVRFHDRQRAESFFQKAKLFVMTSTYEGFANTLIEAQMHGAVPVAFKSFSAIHSMVNNKTDALLTTPYDLNEMENQLLELMRDGEQRNRMARAARENAKRFSEKKVGGLWLVALSELMGDSVASESNAMASEKCDID